MNYSFHEGEKMMINLINFNHFLGDPTSGDGAGCPKTSSPEHLENVRKQREARWCFDQEKPVDLHGDCDCIVDLSGFKWIYKLS